MNFLRTLGRLIVGATFMFSGFVKGIDPLGSAYKFIDYFESFHLDLLAPVALPLAFVLSALEFFIGVSLFFNLFVKRFAWMAMLFMSFFTALTLYIAIDNPVSDCGCFGDAFVITNWQTFYKNLILILFTLIIYSNRRKFRSFLTSGAQSVLFLIIAIAFSATIYHSYSHLPIIDFRPYKVGVNINEGMSIPEGASDPVYENIFNYKNKKTGEIKAFKEDESPWQDSLTWEYVSLKEEKLIDPGYIPPIQDFNIETEEGEDVKDFFLEDENYTFFLVAYDLNKSSKKKQEEINQLANAAMEQGMNFICLTATIEDDLQIFKDETGAPYDFLFSDEITLKTIIRSNPGLLLTRHGDILNKWHYNDIPQMGDIEQLK
ncbi:DoxX family protein [Puteibacter caeruleilacunae]|nr:DoxX family protein [Puteibacter caeruleilacunae]